MSDQPEFKPQDQSTGILAAIVESSDDAIIGKDLSGVVLTWNRGAERMYGYTAGEICGRSLSVVIPPDRPDELRSILERIKAGQRVEPFETVRVTKDGRQLDVSVRVSPIKDGSGRVVGASAITRDISGRKSDERRAQTNEARWRAVVESAVDGIIVIDARGAIEAFNPAAERMFGYSEQDVLGRNVNILMPAPYHEEHDRYVAHYIETGEQKIIGIGREVTGRRRDGQTFPLHLAVGEMRIGVERHFAGILHDLTARVALEERLREQAALARLGEMAAVIAHEVKNPLTAVRGAVQVIGSRLPAGSKDAPIAKEIVARLDALNGLIQDLLLFARVPHPRFAPVDLSFLLRLVADFLSRDPAFVDLRIEVTGSAPAISGDAELLTIVFQNLLINAAQAMQGRGLVRARVTANDASTRIEIIDEGPGIPPEAREKLFRPFHTTKARGTGLGLATAKRLIEAHSGSIAIECPPSGGTTVVVQLMATPL